MKIKVACYSKTGNTMKVAEAMAEELNVKVDKIPSDAAYENEDLLFLGGAIYGAKLDENLSKFISTLTPGKVKKVAAFGTYLKEDAVCAKIKESVRNQGIEVIDECFSCKGKSFMVFNRQHPNKDDLEGAKRFAESVVKKEKAPTV